MCYVCCRHAGTAKVVRFPDAVEVGTSTKTETKLSPKLLFAVITQLPEKQWEGASKTFTPFGGRAPHTRFLYARTGTRTRTGLSPADFKSAAYHQFRHASLLDLFIHSCYQLFIRVELESNKFYWVWQGNFTGLT